MFEQIQTKKFLNRSHLGDYIEVEFDTYIDNRGREEVQDICFPMHYFEAGEGEPLILIHGIGQSIYTWRKNFYELAKEFHVYAIDLPGHGFSGKPHMSYSIEEVALSIEAFMNAMRIEQAHFCTFAESAIYALDFAMHNPDRTGGMIFASPVISGIGKRARGIQSVFGSLAQKMMLNVSGVRNVLEECYFDQTLVTNEVVEEYYGGLSDREFKMISKLYMLNFYDDEIIENISSVKKRMLIMLGADDKITGGKSNEFLSLNFESGSVLNVRNCGYLVHEEKPEKVNEAVVAFLKGSR